MTNKAVSRLHGDIQKLHTAQAKHADQARELHSDEHDLKVDTRKLAHARDGYQKDRKDLTQQRASVDHIREAQQERLGALDSTLATAQAAYDASVDPTTGVGDTTLQAQVATLTQQKADLGAKFGAQLQPHTEAIDELKKQIATGKRTITHEHAVIAHDHKELKHDKTAVAHSKAHVKSARAHALKDLTPAEYEMNLKQTNKARKELGLKSVDHVIRASIPNVVGGQVGKWIAEAQTLLKQAGIPLSKMNARDINTIIQHESSGNPTIVNNWDSNAAAGHPSKGLMQCIQSTFDAHKLPGHNNILNPVDNIIAGVRYAISRYGSISSVPGIVAVHNGGAYVGY